MEITKAIRDFLNYHDSLFLPDFGAFITRYEAAQLNETQNTIAPPYKSIGFNDKMIKEDFSFAKYLSTEFNISLSEANEHIAKFVHACKDELSKKQQYIIPNLGKLYKEKDGSLQFEMNHNAAIKIESFGMQAIKVKKATKPKSNIAMTEKQKSNSLKWVIIVAIILLPFIGIGAWYFIHPVSFNNTLVSIGIKKKEAPIKTVTEIPVQKDTTTVAETNTQPVNDNKTDVQPTTDGYHVIAGSFQVKSNAEKFVNTLQNKGYQSQMFSYGGWFIVSYGAFASKNEAQRLLNKIAVAENPDVWMLKR